ncbi:MAG TPA: hypothetical protein VFO38_01985 [Candidatus Saccharimonadales bacterium]|nr:hypothetical protein [Candidatus Saccharimonadales bacterium]
MPSRDVYEQTLLSVYSRPQQMTNHLLDRLTPHLSLATAKDVLTIEDQEFPGQTCQLALPGLYIRGAYWALSKDQEGLLRVQARRAPTAYSAKDFRNSYVREVDQRSPRVVHKNTATGFGMRNWPVFLSADTSGISPWVVLSDPSRPHAYNNTITTVHAGVAWFTTTSRELYSTPPVKRPKLLEDTFKRCSIAPIEREEMAGDYKIVFSLCAHCGLALSDMHCEKCKLGPVSKSPLPSERVAYLPSAMRAYWAAEGVTFIE